MNDRYYLKSKYDLEEPALLLVGVAGSFYLHRSAKIIFEIFTFSCNLPLSKRFY